MPRKLSERGPELAVWTAVVVALVHRSSIATSPKTPNDRRSELASFASAADEVVELLRSRVESDAEEQERRDAERGGRNA